MDNSMMSMSFGCTSTHSSKVCVMMLLMMFQFMYFKYDFFSSNMIVYMEVMKKRLWLQPVPEDVKILLNF